MPPWSEFSTPWGQPCFVKAGENYGEGNFMIYLGKRLAIIFINI